VVALLGVHFLGQARVAKALLLPRLLKRFYLLGEGMQVGHDQEVRQLTVSPFLVLREGALK